MKKGFTLAEMLVTLTVIGIVASLTIPVVTKNYNKKALYTQFTKDYNTITNMFSLAEAERGTPDIWCFDSNDAAATLKKYLYPYLKTAKICEGSNCSFSQSYKFLDGSSFIDGSEIPMDGSVVILQDGSILYFQTSYSGSRITAFSVSFDTNGAKGPNVIGRDSFTIEYGPDENGKWGVNFSGYPGDEFCNPNGSGNAKTGLGCPDRLLKEGKMDY